MYTSARNTYADNTQGFVSKTEWVCYKISDVSSFRIVGLCGWSNGILQPSPTVPLNTGNRFRDQRELNRIIVFFITF